MFTLLIVAHYITLLIRMSGPTGLDKPLGLIQSGLLGVCLCFFLEQWRVSKGAPQILRNHTAVAALVALGTTVVAVRAPANEYNGHGDRKRNLPKSRSPTQCKTSVMQRARAPTVFPSVMQRLRTSTVFPETRLQVATRIWKSESRENALMPSPSCFFTVMTAVAARAPYIMPNQKWATLGFSSAIWGKGPV